MTNFFDIISIYIVKLKTDSSRFDLLTRFDSPLKYGKKMACRLWNLQKLGIYILQFCTVPLAQSQNSEISKTSINVRSQKIALFYLFLKHCATTPYIPRCPT